MATTDEWTRVVGLAYEPGGELPHVILKGVGAAGDELIRTARRAGVEVVEDAQLVDQLFRVPTDSAIGPELFEVVAMILAHVLAVNRKYQEAKP